MTESRVGPRHDWLVNEAETLLGALMFAWLFPVFILRSVSVVRHADYLAALLGNRRAR